MSQGKAYYQYYLMEKGPSVRMSKGNSQSCNTEDVVTGTKKGKPTMLHRVNHSVCNLVINECMSV